MALDHPPSRVTDLQWVTFTATVILLTPGVPHPPATFTFVEGVTTLGAATLGGQQQHRDAY